ncbi:hypothetical protein ACVWXQ_009901 [Bradyrhizobium sp. S3.14.4]
MHPSQNSPRTGRFRRLLGGVAIVGALAVAGSIATGHYLRAAQATATAAAAEQAVPVTVALIEPKQTVLWDDFSGRLRGHQPCRASSPRRGCDPCDQLHRRRAGEGRRRAVQDRSGALRSRGRQGQRPARGCQSARRVHPERARARRAAGRQCRGHTARLRPARQCQSRSHRQCEGGRSDAPDRKAQSRLHRGACTRGRPRRQVRDHRRQSRRRRHRLPGADLAGVGQSDLRIVRCG